MPKLPKRSAAASPKGSPQRRYALVATLATIAAVGSILSNYEPDIQLISGSSIGTTAAGDEPATKKVASTIVGSDSNNKDTSTNQNKDGKCPQFGTTELSSTAGNGKLVIDKKAIRAQPKDRLDQVKKFTYNEYEQYMMSNPGQEHYPLWHYLTQTYHRDCRHIVDIGTRYVASALALGAAGATIKTFDIPSSTERRFAFRGRQESDWKQDVESNNIHIEFLNLDLLKVSDAEFSQYMATWMIVLDTYHQPYTYPFEREFLQRLVNSLIPFKGIVLLDDIHLNDEMKRWWKEVQENAYKWGYRTYDLTSVGHVSGTGLLDFSGEVVIVE